tara:strand:+ start:281 stop:829 length:549 start_codon:yes stop_codon:yes gene_type:complete
MPDYSNSTIYQIICKDENIKDIYIGSTTNFKRRMIQHRDSVDNYKSRKHKYKLYTFIRAHGGWQNWIMKPIIHYSCLNKMEVAEHERFYYDSLKPSLNDQIPLRTRKEWEDANRPKLNKMANDYYHNNKDKCLESQNKWRSANKEILKIRKKEYYQKNKVIISDKRKIKYALSKETNPLLSV